MRVDNETGLFNSVHNRRLTDVECVSHFTNHSRGA